MKTLVMGAAIIDMVMQVDRIPKSGEDVLGKDVRLMVGGCAYNVASTLRNLKCEHDLCVPVGTGRHADIIKEELMKNNYPILIQDNDKDNGFCLCMVEKSGERTFITVQGLEGEFRLHWFENLDMSQYSNIYIAGYQLCNQNGSIVAKWLSELKDKTIYFAPGPVICDIEKETMRELLAMNPILHLNEKELLDYTNLNTVEVAVHTLYDLSHNTVIVTLGEEGAIYYNGIEIIKVPTVKANVIDTIGAGDSHIGGVLGGISMGMDMEESIAMANRIAAGIVGVQGAVMSLEEFQKNTEGYHG